MKINVLKCKDHFVDCVNVISYEMCNICEKLGALMHFLKNTPSAIKKCPVKVCINFSVFIVCFVENVQQF